METTFNFSFIIENTEITIFYDLPTYIDHKTSSSLPHLHPIHELFILLDGELTLEGDSSRLNLRKQNCCVIPPLTFHSVYRTTNLPTKRITFRFIYKKVENAQTFFDLFSIIASICSKQSSLTTFYININLLNDLSNVMQSTNTNSAHKMQEIKIKNILSLLFINLAEQYPIPSTPAIEPYTKTTEHYTRLFNLSCLLNTYTTPRKKFCIDYDEMTQKMYLSSRQLLNIFQDEFGMSMKMFKHESRMQLAAFALRHFPQMNISHIATYCGYASSEVFSILFKNYYKMSPTKYRQNYSSNDLSNIFLNFEKVPQKMV